MVQIDGGKIRSFREQKGLTQLYLATAVEVTTDTISRWENRRYPTIKKENAIKLAEALEVDLDEILDLGQESENVELEVPVVESTEAVIPPQGSVPDSSMRWKVASLVGLGLAVLVGWVAMSALNGTHIRAVRFMPAHTAPGQPFPVVIKIVSNDSQPSPFILREMLPKGATLVETQKSLPAAVDHKTGEMKWISKVMEKMVLGYSLRYGGTGTPKELKLNGTVTLRKFSGKGEAITGNNRIEFAPYHWADTNKDNYIDDLEILAVYEDYSDATGLDLEMNIIEDIWFGSGYTWNSDTMKFEITP